MAPHSSTLAWETPWTEKPVGYGPGVAQSQTRLSDFTQVKQTGESWAGERQLPR